MPKLHTSDAAENFCDVRPSGAVHRTGMIPEVLQYIYMCEYICTRVAQSMPAVHFRTALPARNNEIRTKTTHCALPAVVVASVVLCLHPAAQSEVSDLADHT